jgi:hypothetical protein
VKKPTSPERRSRDSLLIWVKWPSIVTLKIDVEPSHN